MLFANSPVFAGVYAAIVANNSNYWQKKYVNIVNVAYNKDCIRVKIIKLTVLMDQSWLLS